MKKYLYILAALSIAPNFALAQSLESDVDAELDQVYADQTSAPSSAPVGAGISSTAPVNGGQPIYILNQATPTSTAQVQQTQQQVQKQPTTVIQASPLEESRAEQIRKARQNAEVQTEQKIVEKLENARMEDEKRRADVLFGDKFNQMQQPAQQPQVVQPQVVQPVIVQPVQAPVVQEQTVKEEVNTRDLVREEIAAAMKAEEEAAMLPVETKYIGGILGIGDYPDTKNVKGNYALGVAFGSKQDGLIIEGSFLYSQYTVDTGYSSYNYGYGYGYSPYATGGYYVPNQVDVNQYSGSLAAKIQLFSGIIKPVFGAVVSYSYRTFNWAQNSYGYSYAQNSNSANSHAIDIGTIAGADLEFSPKYSLGLDFRYMWNLNSRRNVDNTFFAGPYASTPIEKLQYYVMSLVGRVNF